MCRIQQVSKCLVRDFKANASLCAETVRSNKADTIWQTMAAVLGLLSTRQAGDMLSDICLPAQDLDLRWQKDCIALDCGQSEIVLVYNAQKLMKEHNRAPLMSG